MPSSSFQRLWPRVGRRVPAASAGLLAAVAGDAPSSAWAQNDVISEINVSGNRRIPADTIKARIFTKPGDVYDAAASNATSTPCGTPVTSKTSSFEREQTPKGWRIIVPGEGKADHPRNQLHRSRVRFPTATCSTVSRRTKSAWWSRASTIPPASRRRKSRSKDLLSEHGRQFATIRTEVRPIPPAAVGITFVVKEGPKVKVGKIKFEGNKNIKIADSARRR